MFAFLSLSINPIDVIGSGKVFGSGALVDTVRGNIVVDNAYNFFESSFLMLEVRLLFPRIFLFSLQACFEFSPLFCFSRFQRSSLEEREPAR